MGTMHPLSKHRMTVLALIAGNNVNVRRSERIRILSQRFNPKFGAVTEWKSNAVANIVYIIQDRDYDSNVDTDDILSLLAEWDAEDCMYTP